MTAAGFGPGFDALPLPAVIVGADGRIAALNDAAEAWLNLSRRWAVGQALNGEEMRIRLQCHPDLGSLIERMGASGAELMSQSGVRFDLGDRLGGHQSRWGDLHLGPSPGGPAGGATLVIVPSDPAQRLAGGASARDAARAAARQAIGMAEMLAHEIKNPLAGIRGAAQLLSMNVVEEDREFTELIVTESRRIVALLDQVERFGDTTAPALQRVNLNELLERARRSAELGFAANLLVQTDYDPSLPDAWADPDQFMQLALNLLKNAAEALEAGRADGHGTTIRIRSYYDSAIRLTDEGGGAARMLPLQVEIEDDGPGIPEAIAAQVFEPFVSGRENGTGLGLALVSKIVADHGGWLRVDSRPGRTVFRISLAKV